MPLSNRTTTVTLNGHSFAVQTLQHADTWQPAPTLVFLHDSLGCIATWRDFPSWLAEETGLDALIYDRLGHGQSGPFDRPRERDYLLREAQEVLPAVLDACGVGRVILFGHSDGGSIALLAAATLGERVRAVITEGAHIFNEETTLQGVREAERTARSSDLPERLKRHHGEKVPALLHAWLDTWQAPWYADWSVEDRLAAIRCPVLIVQGTEDEFGSLEQVYRTVAGVSGPAKPLIIPACGHTPHREAREVMEREGPAFLRQVLA